MAVVLTAIEIAIAVGTVVKALYSFADEAKDAKDDVRRLSLELFALKGALEHFDLHKKDHPLEESLQTQYEEMLRMIKSTLDLIGAKVDTSSRRQRLQQALTWPFKSSDVDKHLQAMERAKTWFIMVILKDSSDTTLAVYDEVKKLSAMVREDIIERQTSIMLGETESVLSWLAPFDTDELLAKATASKMPGTGKWVLDDEFDKWLDPKNEKTPFTWIIGKSGSGKSTLFSTIVEEVRSVCAEPENAGRLFGYHCCSMDNAASQRVCNIFGSVLRNIGRLFPDTLRHVPRDRVIGHGLVPENSLTTIQIKDIFAQVAAQYPCIYILVDALNETSQTAALVEILLDLCAGLPQVRVLVTTTAEPSTSSGLVTRREMRARAVDDDIAIYVQHRLDSEASFQGLSAKIRRQIVVKILSGADGMFRWAKLCMDRLSLLRTGRDVVDALADMPTTLNGTYIGILGRVADHDRPLVREALLWLCFSMQPLNLRELAEAVIVRETDFYIDDDYRLTDPRAIIDICAGLAVVQTMPVSRGEEVTLAHDSVRTFLTSEHIRSSAASYFALDAATAHSSIMCKGLAYLQLDIFAGGPTPERSELLQRRRSHPLFHYASFLWPLHCEQVPSLQPSDERKVLDFFATKKKENGSSFESWVQSLLDETGSLDSIRRTQPLYYAASFNMMSVLRILLRPEHGVDVEQLGGRFSSPPLFVAIWRKNPEAARMLVEAGADPDSCDTGTGLTCRGFARRARFDSLVEEMERRKPAKKFTPRDSTRLAERLATESNALTKSMLTE